MNNNIQRKHFTNGMENNKAENVIHIYIDKYDKAHTLSLHCYVHFRMIHNHWSVVHAAQEVYNKGCPSRLVAETQKWVFFNSKNRVWI